MSYRLLILTLLVCSTLAVSAQQLGDFIYASDVAPVQVVRSGDLGYQLYQIHVQIGEHQLTGAMALVQEDVLVLINTLKDLSSYRVIDDMQKSQDKQLILDTYISSMQSALYATNAAQLQLSSEMKSITADISLCESQKKVYDETYLNALTDASPTQNLDSMVASSQISASCAADKTALLAAKEQLYDTLDIQSNLVGQRYDYLVKERDTILSHFDLLHSDYLQTVLDVQSNIQDGNY